MKLSVSISNRKRNMDIEFEYEKETKNKVRYQELNESDDSPIRIGVLYIDKTAHEELGKPEKLKVTVEAA